VWGEAGPAQQEESGCQLASTWTVKHQVSREGKVGGRNSVPSLSRAGGQDCGAGSRVAVG
jgi:hypothetical protein